MIIVTRRNGNPFALNADLLERAEETPDTVLTLVDGTHYVVSEPVEEIIDRIREFRASVLVRANALDDGTASARPLRVVRHPAEER